MSIQNTSQIFFFLFFSLFFSLSPPLSPFFLNFFKLQIKKLISPKPFPPLKKKKLGVLEATRHFNFKIPLTFVVPDHTSEAKTSPLEKAGCQIIRVSWDKWWSLVQSQDPREVLPPPSSSSSSSPPSSPPPLPPIFLHPVCDSHVIMGNATAGKEILEQLPNVDAIIVPVGGGALITGICLAVRLLQSWKNPKCRVFAVEVETAAPLFPSLEAGKPVKVKYTSSWIDGMGSGDLMPEMWEFMKDWVHGSLVVSLDDVACALREMVTGSSIVAEGFFPSFFSFWQNKRKKK